MGFCSQCRNASPLVEASPAESSRRRRVATATATSVVKISSDSPRLAVGIAEVDRVLGGGFVPGATVLVGGEPGVGKSTLLLHVAGALTEAGAPVIVASAEESLEQVALRCRRLGISDPGLALSADRDVDAIVAMADEIRPALLVVDSIQTVAASEVSGGPGGVAQVRESAARLVHFAKESGVPVVLVGHVTKDGSIAGPKLLEHAVDVVLYLEGEPERGLRILRGLKNRYGPTHQVGLFEMTGAGMVEVADPSALLLGTHLGEVPGSVVFPAVDGRRPLLVEVQALVADSSAPQPRRSVKGVDVARVHQLIAVLERHAGLRFGGKDIYASVVGGLRVTDPGVDLALALVLASSLLGEPLGATAAWGEVGLTGEVRAVTGGDQRMEEVSRLGLTRIISPTGNGEDRIDLALARAGLGP